MEGTRAGSGQVAVSVYSQVVTESLPETQDLTREDTTMAAAAADADATRELPIPAVGVGEAQSQSGNAETRNEVEATPATDLELPSDEADTGILAPQEQVGEATGGEGTDLAVIQTETPSQELGTGITTPQERTSDTAAEQSTDSSTEQSDPPPPPPPNPDIPDYVTWEDDATTPDEAELKEIEEAGSEKSALDAEFLEKKFFSDVEDPEQRPVKKIRLSWVIKGVRGTKERPNRARTINSPCAYIDGHYWQLKFFPRGNKSSSLSAYIRCTKKEPKADHETPESTFMYFEGPPDANVGEGAEPKSVLKTAATPAKSSENKDSSAPEKPDAANKTDGEPDRPDGTTNPPAEVTEQPTSTPPADPSSQEPADEQPPDPEPQIIEDPNEAMERILDEALEEQSKADTESDYRVSAQLGMAIYNPEEPRTNAFNSSEHQFTRYNDDWGWTNFVGPWQEIHKRQRGERQALLKNDTIAIDAYIRVFEDPSQALWWHRSHEHENIWPSKKLAGYFPMGTPPLYHSPAVAGITAWLLIAPFRKIIENFDAGKWRQDSQVKPRPLIARLQQVLHLMRHLKRDEYVNVHPVIETLREYGETYNDVLSFWEVFRRSIELELDDDREALSQISKIIDAGGKSYTVPSLPVRGMVDIRHALSSMTLPADLTTSLPNFLPLRLEREVFDKISREWKLFYDRVTLNDEIDMPHADTTEKYTLYGFMVHVGERSSGRFYSVLRPHGPGTKWLAFEDGDGNKIYSYTRKRLEEYEGLIGEELEAFKMTRPTAYMAMYIRNTCLPEYLPGELHDYHVPKWLQPVQDSYDPPPDHEDEAKKDNVALEIYHDEGLIGRSGLLDMFNVKQQSLAGDHFKVLSVPRDMTFQDLRQQLADERQLEQPEALRIFMLAYGDLGQYTSARWARAELKSKVGDHDIVGTSMCLWTSILKTEDQIKTFGCPNEVAPPPVPEPAPAAEGVAAAELATPGSEPLAEMSAADEISTDSIAPATTQPAPVTGNSPAREARAEYTVAELVSSLEPEVNVNAPVVETAPVTSIAEATPATAVQPEAVSEDVSSPTLDAVEPPAPAAVLDDTESSSPVADTEGLPVEHGHLIDAVMAETAGPQHNTVIEHAAETAPSIELQDQSVFDENEAVVAALIAADVQGMTEVEEPLQASRGPIPTLDDILRTADLSVPDQDAAVAEMDTGDGDDGDQATPEAEPRSVESSRVRNVYGFVQLFDTEKQDFIVNNTFFARVNEPAKEAIRRSLGYEKDKRFHLWHREGLLEGSTVNDKSTFDEINFADGVDMIVGEIISEDRIEQLRKAGKFSHPFALSRYLRMAERKHPTQSKTTTEPVEMAEFGMNYYKGPLMNGQPHGDSCLMVSANGHTYEGPLVCNQKEGKAGKITYQNGDTYEGEWHNDERHGNGVFVEKRTGNKYVGGFQNGKRWGKGITHWEVADEEADMCQICYSEDIDALFFDCGHVCACMSCAKQCECCPICRKSIRQVVRMFWA